MAFLEILAARLDRVSDIGIGDQVDRTIEDAQVRVAQMGRQPLAIDEKFGMSKTFGCSHDGLPAPPLWSPSARSIRAAELSHTSANTSRGFRGQCHTHPGPAANRAAGSGRAHRIS